ncbi:L-threonylcarbamoyladenylate synthase [Salinactinospora qingdaonensis]|uniref:L-threonylcarbamoyladenylate synthase n=1 Tax=Salinactinospora qingdaonensis TaxID=702744 RepID=A0ABP7FQE6_9ACTN
MSRSYNCAVDDERSAGLLDAASTVRKGELAVLPTDTVYGIGADAFNPTAVRALLDAKGRGREMPPPVLVGSVRAAHALIDDLGSYGQDLIDEFWPGPLTIVCAAVPSLSWDLGDTKGTVAVRMPMHEVALELLKDVGPMAVSSANRSGETAATTVEQAREQLGDSVAVYLDGGPCDDASVPSTIVDLTYAVPRVLRSGAISVEQLRAVCSTVLAEPQSSPEQSAPPRTPDAGSDAADTGAAEGGETDTASRAEANGAASANGVGGDTTAPN